ncbi:MAG: dihydrolipoyl dehydrogenase [Myxococcales bacterium]|nr:dihydrolipoyl dehydrogenase [Myxococcales bacterium]MCB9641994.1 dihydrolipoyl dehydrogenase [Myxococcales bacterium]
MVVGNLNASEGCDALVIGAGPGGYVCAIRLAQLGKDVILVDARASLGGVCLNEGCIPSKALIHAAETFEHLQHADSMGIVLEGTARIDMPKLKSWKDSVVKRLTGGVATMEKMNGVRVMQGTARFLGPNQVELMQDGRPIMIDFEQAVIATGTTAIELPFMPFDGEFVIGSREALDLEEVPEKLVVIGGGYIGLELGTAYKKLGADVTVVEMMDQLLGGSLEPEINSLLNKRCKQLGIQVLLQHKAISAKPGKLGEVVVEDKDGKQKTLPANKVLVAVGRRPNTSKLDLATVGLQADAQGFIQVDIERRTAVPHIFAIGDITEQPMLAHKAYREAKVAAEVIAGHPAAYDVRVVPAVMFTDPEIASAGMTEAQAREAGYNVQIGVFPLKASGRAMTLGAPEGLTKVVVDMDSQRLLGVHIAGPQAGELIGEGTLALELDAFIDDIGHTIHAHPTLSEAVLEAAEIALGTCAHFASPKR